MKSFEMTQTMMKKMKSPKGGMNKMLKGMDINQLKDNLKLTEEIFKDGIKIYG